MPDDPEQRVIDLREAAARRERKSAPIGDELAPYHAADEDAGEYRHRMRTNIAALAVLAALIVGGIWIANTMAAMRKNQDCVLSGRRGCTPVDVPVQQRW
jgi:hypothetical protein